MRTFGYKFTKSCKSLTPGPGTYNIRTKLKSEKQEIFEKNPKQKIKKKKK